jgi:hypothetical protein
MDRMKRNTSVLIWIGFIGSVLLILGVKAWQVGWLRPKTSLELNGQPTVLVFVKYRYVCECEGYVNGNARSQVVNWPMDALGGVPLHLIDIEQRTDLVKRYKVIRAPSMLLLNADGEIVWRQDDVISDELPLDLSAAEAQILALLESENLKKQ